MHAASVVLHFTANRCADECHKLGMQVILWLDPESILISESDLCGLDDMLTLEMSMEMTAYQCHGPYFNPFAGTDGRWDHF